MDTLSLRQTDGMQLIRHSMIEDLMHKGINSGSVLDVMARVPRHLFVSEALRYRAYEDVSLPIGFGQTLSRPSVIGRMVQALNLTGSERVLEIGTGSGYQSAVLSALAHEVVTMERIDMLYQRARNVIFSLRYPNVTCVHSGDFNEVDGMFDAIVVAAGADIMPVEILDKLNPGGRLVIPVVRGNGHSIKRLYLRHDGSVMEDEIGDAVFVPLILN